MWSKTNTSPLHTHTVERQVCVCMSVYICSTKRCQNGYLIFLIGSHYFRSIFLCGCYSHSKRRSRRKSRATILSPRWLRAGPPRCRPRSRTRSLAQVPSVHTAWWFFATPLKNMKVSWDDYSKYIEKYKMFQTTHQQRFEVDTRF